MSRVLLALAILTIYLLHQDVWFWTSVRPLVFGFLPVGLAYHAVYCLAAAALMWALTKSAWPTHLEEAARSMHSGQARSVHSGQARR
jgi:hypothetical protein